MATGRRGEALAARYLERRGLRIVGRNVRTRVGEIDLVAYDEGTLVLVEVRAVHRALVPGHPATAITHAKARQVLRAARYYLAALPGGGRGVDVRIDALGIELDTNTVEYLPGAIRADLVGRQGAAQPRRG